MSLQVEKISDQKALEKAFEIREKVFVIEQGVDKNEEYDQFEDISNHFLAKRDGQPIGTCRWRFTSDGIKLERFAVLQEERGKGAGQALVSAVLKDIAMHADTASKTIYLHAQLEAVPLYAKFGFQKVGEIFEECNIQHFKMVLK